MVKIIIGKCVQLNSCYINQNMQRFTAIKLNNQEVMMTKVINTQTA